MTGRAPETDRARLRFRRIVHAEGEGADRRAVQSRELGSETAGLSIDEEIDIALAIERHRLAAMPRDSGEPRCLELTAEAVRIRRREFDELEAVGTHGIGSVRAHAGFPCNKQSSAITSPGARSPNGASWP